MHIDTKIAYGGIFAIKYCKWEGGVDDWDSKNGSGELIDARRATSKRTRHRILQPL